MDILQVLDHFEFHPNGVLHEKVESMTADFHAVIPSHELYLITRGQTAFP